VEHLYGAGIWIGARLADGTIHVSTSGEDTVDATQAAEIREFTGDENPLQVMSNDQSSEDYHPDALATHHLACGFHDDVAPQSGDHVPLGIEVHLDALSWSPGQADDFVILDYRIVNVSANVFHDVYVGFWNDTTVGNTEYTDPYDPGAPVVWDYYDDQNGAWRPGDVPGDPDIWMMWERDDDGDEGHATSWVGTRLLGSVPEPEPSPDEPPVSYNAWRFRNVPPEDDEYLDEFDLLQPGKYQLMSNGDFDVGVTPEIDFTVPSDWLALLSTGPIPFLAPGDTMRVTFAMICGPDSLGLLEHAKQAQEVYNQGMVVVSTYLAALTVVRDGEAAELQWHLTSPQAGIRFHIWRRCPDGARQRLTISPLPATCTSFRDEAAPAHGVTYRLQGIDTRGTFVLARHGRTDRSRTDPRSRGAVRACSDIQPSQSVQPSHDATLYLVQQWPHATGYL
jgi:hypothetical protein